MPPPSTISALTVNAVLPEVEIAPLAPVSVPASVSVELPATPSVIVPLAVAPVVVPVTSLAIVVLCVRTGIAADVPPMNVNVPVVP